MYVSHQKISFHQSLLEVCRLVDSRKKLRAICFLFVVVILILFLVCLFVVAGVAGLPIAHRLLSSLCSSP
jgi:hypothetical protein